MRIADGSGCFDRTLVAASAGLFCRVVVHGQRLHHGLRVLSSQPIVAVFFRWCWSVALPAGALVGRPFRLQSICLTLGCFARACDGCCCSCLPRVRPSGWPQWCACPDLSSYCCWRSVQLRTANQSQSIHRPREKPQRSRKYRPSSKHKQLQRVTERPQG